MLVFPSKKVHFTPPHQLQFHFLFLCRGYLEMVFWLSERLRMLPRDPTTDQNYHVLLQNAEKCRGLSSRTALTMINYKHFCNPCRNKIILIHWPLTYTFLKMVLERDSLNAAALWSYNLLYMTISEHGMGAFKDIYMIDDRFALP